MQIITGKTGTPHITSVQDRMFNRGVVGKEAYVLNTGENLRTEIFSANEIRIYDGMLITQGCTACVEINTYDSITIENGTQGMKRKDIIAARYKYNGSLQTESMEWVVIKGTPDAESPQMPEITNSGSIQALDSIVDTAVFVVNIEGVAITSVERLINLSTAINANNKILWSGNSTLGENVTIKLYEPISKQAHGIILVFALCDKGVAYGDMGTFIIPKEIVGDLSGRFVFDLGTSAFGTNARKRFAVLDNQVIGEEYNTNSGTMGGIIFDNSKIALVKVLGW